VCNGEENGGDSFGGKRAFRKTYSPEHRLVTKREKGGGNGCWVRARVPAQRKKKRLRPNPSEGVAKVQNNSKKRKSRVGKCNGKGGQLGERKRFRGTKGPTKTKKKRVPTL